MEPSKAYSSEGGKKSSGAKGKRQGNLSLSNFKKSFTLRWGVTGRLWEAAWQTLTLLKNDPSGYFV